MALTLDTTNITITGDDAREISQVSVKQIFESEGSKLLDYIQTGVRNGDEILATDGLGEVGRVGDACDLSDTNTITFSDERWDLKPINGRMEFCRPEALNSAFKLFQRQQSGDARFYNIFNQGQEFESFVLSLYVPAIENSISRFGWFGKLDTPYTSPEVTTGLSLDLLNGISGFWEKIFAGINVGSQYVEISQNAEATKSLQNTMTPTQAYEYLLAMIDLATPQMRLAGELELHVTDSLARKYQRYLVEQGASFNIDLIANGVQALNIDGIPIKVRKDWTNIIGRNFDLSTTYDKPHRAVLSPPRNLIMGTALTEDSEFINAFYDNYQRKNVFEFRYELGTHIDFIDNIVVAY